MYAIYGNMDPINIPQMLAYIMHIYHTWIRHGLYIVWLCTAQRGWIRGDPLVRRCLILTYCEGTPIVAW